MVQFFPAACKQQAMPKDTHKITNLLIDWRAGRPEAAEELMNLVYAELRILAARFMRRELPGHTLQTTALVHEAYIRLCDADSIDWQNRAHFFAVAAQQVRRVLVDHARRTRAEKRWGVLKKVSLADVNVVQIDRGESLLELDEALGRLAQMDARAASVVELRYFGGLTEREPAEVLNISTATLKRDWEFARTWLVSQLT
jgi:RNA polymerase sigma factor (TIGR02999 family)